MRPDELERRIRASAWTR